MSLVSIVRFLGTPDTVVRPECTLDIALWVKLLTELKQIRDFDVHLRGFGKPTPEIVVRPEGTIDLGV